MTHRVVVGTSSLGSTLAQAASSRLIRAAVDAGFSAFDTAPGYGAGFAPSLLAELARRVPAVIHVSTKVGGWQDSAWRTLAKRVLRARQWSQIFARGAPSVTEAMRESAAWWSGDAVLRQMDFAIGQLRPAAPDICFLHAPPVLLDATSLERLARAAIDRGAAGLGIASPCDGDLDEYSKLPESTSPCLQIHLDQWLRIAPSTRAQLLARPLWIHGIYSPGAGASVREFPAREAAAREICRSAPITRIVVGIRSLASLRKLEAFAKGLGS